MKQMYNAFRVFSVDWLHAQDEISIAIPKSPHTKKKERSNQRLKFQSSLKINESRCVSINRKRLKADSTEKLKHNEAVFIQLGLKFCVEVVGETSDGLCFGQHFNPDILANQ
ncbi:hypothetical protein CRM22_002847 [Opisthorchis felineus]|uniref:Uncharacterized protein n=1 Tax=Opisthorchis felineus TaxID=147828 RepID=A0A4S2M438_OPIFE|nr:hypothetical protein CRM22_002847 [Opisthorchis felineus]